MTRYCTRCGQATTQQNKNLFTCAAGHENWVNPVAGATVYPVKDGKVLYGVRSLEPGSGKLCVPGGFIEVDETAEQTARRETKEELGIDVELLACLGTYTSSYFGRPILNVVFVGTFGDQSIMPGDDLNGGQPVWYNIDSLPPIGKQSWEWYGLVEPDLLKWWHGQKN